MTLVPATPEELAQKRQTALGYVRARAAVKANLASGDVQLETILAAGHRNVGDPVLGRLRIGQVLNALPGWGPVRVGRLLEQLHLNPKRHLDTLSQDVCDAILAAVSPDV